MQCMLEELNRTKEWGKKQLGQQDNLIILHDLENSLDLLLQAVVRLIKNQEFFTKFHLYAIKYEETIRKCSYDIYNIVSNSMDVTANLK